MWRVIAGFDDEAVEVPSDQVEQAAVTSQQNEPTAEAENVEIDKSEEETVVKKPSLESQETERSSKPAPTTLEVEADEFRMPSLTSVNKPRY